MLQAVEMMKRVDNYFTYNQKRVNESAEGNVTEENYNDNNKRSLFPSQTAAC